MTAKTKAKRFVLVTTAKRAVLAGYLETDKAPAHVTLSNARCVLYWDVNVRGVFGLASGGPTDKCRLGSVVLKIKLFDVTSITDISKEAKKAWDAAK